MTVYPGQRVGEEVEAVFYWYVGGKADAILPPGADLADLRMSLLDLADVLESKYDNKPHGDVDLLAIRYRND